MTDLHQGVYLADLLLAALDANLDKPAVHIGDDALTGAQMRDEISRYAQAFASLGITKGTPVSVISANRPEVIFNMGACMVTGCRTTPLHPLGSLEDHAYVLEDAGIETLVFDPLTFGGRAAELRERVPGLKHLLAFGPSDVGEDLLALAAGFEPQPLRAPKVEPTDVSGLIYTGGTTGKPKGVMSSYRSSATMTQIQMAEWEWPEDLRFLICTPLSHAGAAFIIPTLLRGGSIARQRAASTRPRSSRRSRSTRSPRRCSSRRCSTC